MQFDVIKVLVGYSGSTTFRASGCDSPACNLHFWKLIRIVVSDSLRTGCWLSNFSQAVWPFQLHWLDITGRCLLHSLCRGLLLLLSCLRPRLLRFLSNHISLPQIKSLHSRTISRPSFSGFYWQTTDINGWASNIARGLVVTLAVLWQQINNYCHVSISIIILILSIFYPLLCFIIIVISIIITGKQNWSRQEPLILHSYNKPRL